MPSPDGCNTCVCQADGSLACTKNACPDPVGCGVGCDVAEVRIRDVVDLRRTVGPMHLAGPRQAPVGLGYSVGAGVDPTGPRGIGSVALAQRVAVRVRRGQ